MSEENKVSLPQWAAKPKRKEALEEVEHDYLEHFIDLRLAELGKTRKDMMSSFDEPARTRLIGEASAMALEAMTGTEELHSRAGIHLGLTVLRNQLQVYDRNPKNLDEKGNPQPYEDESFLAYLMRKHVDSHSPGTVSEIEFLIQLMMTMYSQGQGEWVEETFRSIKYFGKFKKSVKELRRRDKSVKAASKHFNEQIEQLKMARTNLLKQLNTEKDPAVKEQLAAKRENVKLEISKMEQHKEETVGILQQELTETLYNAIVMTNMDEVHANDDPKSGEEGIARLLARGVKPVHPKDEEGNEIKDKWVLEYPESDRTLSDGLVGRAEAHKMFVNSHVAYVFHLPISVIGSIEPSLETFLELKEIDPLYGIVDLIKQAEMEDSIVQKLIAILKSKKSQTHAKHKPHPQHN